MALAAVPPGGMFHPNGGHRARAHMAGNAIAAHLKFMGNRRRCSGQGSTAQPRRRDTGPVMLHEQLDVRHRNVALPAGGVLGMGCDGRMPLQFLRPPALGMAGQTLNWGQIRLFDLMRDIGR